MSAQETYIVVPAHIARGAESITSLATAKERAEQLVARDRQPRVVLQVISTFSPTQQVRVTESAS